MDSTSWGYLEVSGKAKKSQLKKGNSIMLQSVTSIENKIIRCTASDVVPLSSPALDAKKIEKMVQQIQQEEQFSTLSSIKKDTYEKTNVLVTKVCYFVCSVFGNL